MSRRLRILLVDDHSLVRSSLVELLSRDPGMEVVGEAPDGVEACSKAQDLCPDVILLDLHMPRLDGLSAMPHLAKMAPDAAVVVLTYSADEGDVKEALSRGARGYVLKGAEPDMLPERIRQAVGRGTPPPEVHGR